MFHSKSQNAAKPQKEKYWTFIRVRWFVLRIAMILFDICAVNLAYFLAFVLRFYVGGDINDYAEWCIPAFKAFAPYYTVCCLAVFFCFRLYSGMWKYAGINDMNRIVGANAVTFGIQVLGSMLFVRRMPITYYLLGGLIQFFFIAGSRFSYRLISMERAVALKGRNQTNIRVMIAGMGETARIIRKEIDRDHTNAACPVCMFSWITEDAGMMLDGIPVVRGLDKLKDNIQKYRVECVILADSMMPEKIRKEIKAICREADVGVQDFSAYFQLDGAELPLVKLMQYAGGPVELVIDGQTQTYSDGEQAVMSVEGKYDVQSICAHDGKLVVEASRHQVVLNNLNEDWVHEFEEETGESISFF